MYSIGEFLSRTADQKYYLLARFTNIAGLASVATTLLEKNRGFWTAYGLQLYFSFFMERALASPDFIRLISLADEYSQSCTSR